jgi:putative ABC transport system permease protein
MRFLTPAKHLCRTLLAGHSLDADVDEELRAHLDLLVDEKVRAGMRPDVARRTALLEIGGIEQVKEAVRHVRIGFWINSLWRDVRYGARLLLRNPRLTLVAVLSLALGIGLNTAVFSIIHAVFVRPLPYTEPDRIVSVSQTHPAYPRPLGVSAANYFDWRRQNHVFERMAVYQPTDAVLSGEVATARVLALRVSADYFAVLGVPPALGRAFEVADDRAGASTVIISDALWRCRWHADPRIVGQTITLNSAPHTVIGVMPPDFRVYDEWGIPAPNHTYDLWLPYPFESHVPTNRSFDTLWVIARLKRGVSLEQAQEEMLVVGRRLARQYPVENKDRGVWVTRLSDQLARPSWDVLRLVWIVVALVLLLACTNIAALLLARATARAREMAVRAALGAGRLRILRQVLTETTLLTLSCAALGVLMGGWARRLLPFALPEAELIARLGEARVNAGTLAFTVVLAVSTGVLCGLAPALAASKPDLRDTLNDGGRTGVSVRRTRFLNALLVCQLSLSLLLLSGAGVLLRSLWRLSERPLGFDATNLLTFETRLPSVPPYVRDAGVQQFPELGAAFRHRLAPTETGVTFPERVLEHLRAVPGVQAASAGLGMPMLRTDGGPFRTDAQPRVAPPQRAEDVDWNQEAWICPVSSDYFRALDMPVLEGRPITEQDRAGGVPVAVVNRALATKYWRRGPVVGRHLTLTLFVGPRPVQRTYEVVGVVDDIRAWPVMGTDMAIFTPLAQAVQSSDVANNSWGLDYRFAVKLANRDSATVRAITGAIYRYDPAVPVENVRFMADVVSQAFAPWRVLMWLLVVMGGAALLLACIGIYGVTTYTMIQRTHELGVRVALGATAHDIVRPALTRAAVLALIGCAAGLLPVFWFNRLLADRLYGVSPGDPVTLVVVAVLLVLVTLVAVWWPARKAAKADPLTALRRE